MTMMIITVHITTIAPTAPAIAGIGIELEEDEEASVRSALGISMPIGITVNFKSYINKRQVVGSYVANN